MTRTTSNVLPSPLRRWLAGALALLLTATPVAPLASAQQPAPFTIRRETSLVLVDVVARDRQGNPVRGLTRDDFEVLEDGKPQRVSTFDYENVDQAPAPATTDKAEASQTPAPAAAKAKQAIALPQSTAQRRLIVLFFDLSSMQPEEIQNAIQSATGYVNRQMKPADMVAVATLSTSFKVVQQFTDDRTLLRHALNALNPTAQNGFEQGTTGSSDGTADTGAAFTADDTEYNIFNTDYRLQVLRSVAEMLAPIQQKKSVLYFSGGVSRTGLENETELRAAINAAVRANVAFYAVDTRGLQANVPGGEAQNGSLQGTSAYSGAAQRQALDSNFTSQETLTSLASDTGGKALLDSNDFAPAFTQVQADSSVYYELGYHSGNAARDGRYRRIQVRCKRPGVKLEYRAGYFAPKDYQHYNRDEREQQLDDELEAEVPDTQLPLYLAAASFRADRQRDFLAVAVAVPGAALTLAGKAPSVDFAAAVKDPRGFVVGSLHQTVSLAQQQLAGLRTRNLQFNSGFLLLPGRYKLRVVARENQTGLIGSFETVLDVPKFQSSGPRLALSSVLAGSQIVAVKKKIANDPLTSANVALVPSITHVFSARQNLYLQYEAYQPARAAGEGKGIDVLSSAALYRDGLKVRETQPVAIGAVTDPRRQAVTFRLQIPLSGLAPGLYLCQVNAIDSAGQRFAFTRFPLLIRHARAAVPSEAQAVR